MIEFSESSSDEERIRFFEKTLLPPDVLVDDVFTIQIIYDGSPIHYRHDFTALMAEAEENLSDLLPAGYRARIRRWDHPGTEDENDE